MDKFKEQFRRFMAGRYGVDYLNQFLIYFSLIVSVIGFLLGRNAGRFTNMISSISIFYALFRMMSRNVNARYQENIKFNKAIKPIRAEIEVLKMRFRDRKTHKYVKCDNCKKIMRVPKNVGKVKIRCSSCGNEFYKRT